VDVQKELVSVDEMGRADADFVVHEEVPTTTENILAVF
jgi:hypothetical protein